MPTMRMQKRRTCYDEPGDDMPGGCCDGCGACGHIFDTEDGRQKMMNNPKRGGCKTATRAANHAHL